MRLLPQHGQLVLLPDPHDAMYDLAAIKRALVLHALAETEGNQKAAARLLGISPRQMNYLMGVYGLPQPLRAKMAANRAQRAQAQTPTIPADVAGTV